MFSNTVNLHPFEQGNLAVVLIDGPANRRTLRSSAGGDVRLSIAHTESKENPGFTTQRSNIRLEQEFPVDESDKTVTGYVQLTLSAPKQNMSLAQARILAARLVSFLLQAENAEDEAGTVGIDQMPAFDRLYAGEP